MVPFFHGSLLLVKELQLSSEEHPDFFTDKWIYFFQRAAFFFLETGCSPLFH